jgi:hypothetical protein
MKSAATCIALTVILSCYFSAQAISKPQQPDIPVAWTSLVAWPIASPNSLPFVFSSFTTTGTVTNPFDDIAAGATAQIGPARAGPHHNELPLNDDVITFPKQ